MEKKLFSDKKGNISTSVWALVGVAVAFVVVGLVLAFGQLILEDTQSDMTANSYAYNSTTDAQKANAKISGKLPLIGTVIVAVIIIGLLIAGFAGFMMAKAQ